MFNIERTCLFASREYLRSDSVWLHCKTRNEHREEKKQHGRKSNSLLGKCAEIKSTRLWCSLSRISRCIVMTMRLQSIEEKKSTILLDSFCILEWIIRRVAHWIGRVRKRSSNYGRPARRNLSFTLSQYDCQHTFISLAVNSCVPVFLLINCATPMTI